MIFTTLLLQWFRRNSRDLPWKHTKDPYKIWLSEIILQQTRVEQGYDYYLKFVKQYPTVGDLAKAPQDEVLKLWQGLGYYSRARNLHYTAQTIVNELNGKFPDNYAALLKLKGVGEYTAAAIASFAYDEAVPALDGNGYRILSRVFGVETPIDETVGKKELQALAKEVLPVKEAAAFNQALMDFGSLVCTPKNAGCINCPISDICFACRNDKVYQLPVKSKKIEVKSRYFHYFIIADEKYLYIRQRAEKDIWQGLYEFPMIETDTAVEEDKIKLLTEWKNLFGEGATILRHSALIKHQLTHRTLWTRFYLIKVEQISKNIKENYLKIPANKFEQYSIPRLIDAFLEKHAEEFLGCNVHKVSKVSRL